MPKDETNTGTASSKFVNEQFGNACEQMYYKVVWKT